MNKKIVRNQKIYWIILLVLAVISIPNYAMKLLPLSMLIFFALSIVFSRVHPAIISFFSACTAFFIQYLWLFQFFAVFVFHINMPYRFPENAYFMQNIILIATGIFAGLLLDMFLSYCPIPKIRMAIYAAIYSIFLLLLFESFDTNINTVYYDIHIKDLPAALNGATIVHISDLHSTIHGDKQKQLMDKINAAQPDLIFLTGDIADDNEPFFGTQLLLEQIASAYPIYYVTGNHEFWADDFFVINQKFRDLGVETLEDESVICEINGEPLLIAGLDDPDVYMKKEIDPNIAARLAAMENDDFEGVKLLLSHRPELIKHYQSFDYDAVFSGHAHGGQFRLPFTSLCLYAPNQGFFPEYAGGAYLLDSKNESGTIMVVSRGLSVNVNFPRLFNPPELVVVRLWSS